MPVYNSQPRPRVLFEALPPELADELASLVPTANVVQEGEEVHESEYDLLVTWAAKAGERSGHLHVLSFGATELDAVRPPKGFEAFGWYPTRKSRRTLASEVTIASEADSEMRALLERTVVANLPPGEKYGWELPMGAKALTLTELGAEGLPHVLLWSRTSEDGSALSLVLPAETTDNRAWLIWFLRWLNSIDSVTFPGDPDWTTAREWSTSNTLAIHDEIAGLEKERSQLLALLDDKEREAVSRLEDAQAADKVGYQRLLTADGDELESAVQDALTEFGFTVHSMDGHHDKVTKAKLEDLRVSDPEDPRWAALVEIKGYTKGAKTNDVNQILGRPMRAYIVETTREPSTVWHVVNPERTVDPSMRKDAITNDLDLEALTEAGGALIETRQLFLALRAVQSGQADAASIKLSLKDALTRWDFRKVDPQVG